jgi:hypothetical protein
MALSIELQPVDTGNAPGPVRLRALLFNGGYEPVTISRNAFVGPNLSVVPDGEPRPESVEPTLGGPEELLTLQPFTFYGRERTFDRIDGRELALLAYYRGPGADAEIRASEILTLG